MWTWSCSFLSARGLAYQVALTNTKVKLDLLTGIDMLLMVEKSIRGAIRHYWYEKPNNKHVKNMMKIKTRHIFNIGMIVAKAYSK